MKPRPRYLVTVKHHERLTEKFAVAEPTEVAIIVHRWAELREKMPVVMVTFLPEYRGRNYEKVMS